MKAFLVFYESCNKKLSSHWLVIPKNVYVLLKPIHGAEKTVDGEGGVERVSTSHQNLD